MSDNEDVKCGWKARADELSASLVQVAQERDAARAALEAATSPVPGLANSGPYTLADVELIERHRGKPYTRLRETVLALQSHDEVLDGLVTAADELAKVQKALDEERSEARALKQQLDDATALCHGLGCGRCESCVTTARADAARLREELVEAGIVLGGTDRAIHQAAFRRVDAALSATDSGEWLAQHDAEVAKAERAKMNGELLAAHLVENAAQERAFALTEKCASLETQLAAATNDAARAELRARELGAFIRLLNERDLLDMGWSERANKLLAASTDSDARLREVMLKVGHAIENATSVEVLSTAEIEALVDEVLRGGA